MNPTPTLVRLYLRLAVNAISAGLDARAVSEARTWLAQAWAANNACPEPGVRSAIAKMRNRLTAAARRWEVA
jgi:hypothetical protein